jgi:hypothetical protein
MNNTLMVNCFVFTKECNAYVINEKREMTLFNLKDHEANTIIDAAKERNITSIMLWGPAAFCKRLREEILEIDNNLEIECK